MSRVLLHMAAAILGAMFLVACDGSGSRVPTSLIDGSRVAQLQVQLEGVASPVALTSVTAMDVGEIGAGSAFSECLSQARSDPPSSPIVVRVGLSGESMTFVNRSRQGVYGCDNSDGLREDERRWCGVAFAQLSGGRLEDPRLDLGGCTTKAGASLGFGWVQPIPSVKYVAVEHDGYVEVYETARGLPVRVTTSDVQIERSSATFRVSEHASDGRLIRKYRLEASVAG